MSFEYETRIRCDVCRQIAGVQIESQQPFEWRAGGEPAWLRVRVQIEGYGGVEVTMHICNECAVGRKISAIVPAARLMAEASVAPKKGPPAAPG